MQLPLSQSGAGEKQKVMSQAARGVGQKFENSIKEFDFVWFVVYVYRL
jgi:hypothetical protein